MLLETLGDSMLGNMLTGKGVLKAGKGSLRAGRGYGFSDNVIHIWLKIIWIRWKKSFSSAPSFKQYQYYQVINNSLGLILFFQEIIYLE